jgi:hypothetical protein
MGMKGLKKKKSSGEQRRDVVQEGGKSGNMTGKRHLSTGKAFPDRVGLWFCGALMPQL